MQSKKAAEILIEAQPEVEKAQAALNVVDVKELTKFKSLNNPPGPVAALGITIMILKPNGNED